METMTETRMGGAASLRLVALVLASVWLPGAAGRAAEPVANAAGSGIGQELKVMERDVLEQAETLPPKSNPEAVKALAVPANGQPEAAEAAKPADKAGGFVIATMEIRGDQDLLETTGLLEPLRAEVVGKTLTREELTAIATRYESLLVKSGYYMAKIYLERTGYQKGALAYEVDGGRFGKVTFYERPPAGAAAAGTNGAAKAPFAGRWFSAAQLERRLQTVREGNYFDYEALRLSILGVNTHPDLTMDTDIRVRKEYTPTGLKRHADLDFYVEEHLPLHTVLSFGNSGTKATGNWRPSATVQYLNLTKHDDVLSVNFGPVSLPDIQNLKSGALSYYVPHYWGQGGAFTFYAGYSDLDARDVVEGIDIQGMGWFGGAQGSYRLVQNDRHYLAMSVGLVYRYIEDQIILNDAGGRLELDPRDVTLVPLSLAFSYASTRADALGGRNFLTLQTIGNVEGALGGSDAEELRTLRQNADATYAVERMQAARIQPILGRAAAGEGAPRSGQWLVFLRLDGQVATGPLIPAEQKPLGGMDSVRGFPERIAQGDHGVSGTLELRTPLLTGFLGSVHWMPGERELALKEGQSLDRLQLVTFLDAGHVTIQDAVGIDDSYTLGSAGLGFRVSLTSHAQMRFDWGVPVFGRSDVETPTEDVSAGGRYHLSAQVQF